MSIQKTEGQIVLDATDWQRSFGGTRFGIKLRDFAGSGTYTTICVLENGAWRVDRLIYPDMQTNHALTVDGWIATVAQTVNVWLAAKIPTAPQITTKPSIQTAGTIIEQIDKSLPQCLMMQSGSVYWPTVKRIAVIGDSISTRNNGASATSWPELLDSMIKSLGVFDIEVRNYSIPGLTWKTAAVATDGWTIGGALSPVDAVRRDGADLIIVCMGVNDRANPNASSDALAFQAALPAPAIYARQMFSSTPAVDVVSDDEQTKMNDVYAALGGDGFGLGLGKLYEMGFTYDGLHPTDSGKQWIASGAYMYLQQFMPLTPIFRNIAWLYSMRGTLTFDQMIGVHK